MSEILAHPAINWPRIAEDGLVRRYKCRICGKITAGRMSSGGPDETGFIPFYPRKHGPFKGATCPGSNQKAIYVYVPERKRAS